MLPDKRMGPEVPLPGILTTTSDGFTASSRQGTPLMLAALVFCRLVPVRLTLVPPVPVLGLIELMEGVVLAGGAVTVNWPAEVSDPAATKLTLMNPVVAPGGTEVFTTPLPSVVYVAFTPLKVTEVIK